MNLSIIVCVYNGEKDIGRCLESLANQNVSQDLFEVIVVNNNSTDKTEEIAKIFYDKIKNYRIINETNVGLSNARNRGYKEAKCEYVGYIDDDSKAREDWVEKALRIINDFSPDIFGGPIYPFYVTEKPSWFKDQYEIRLEKKESCFMTDGTISGSNIFFKKNLLEEYNGFNPNYGMKGNSFGYGEETLLVRRALKENKKVYYSIDLIVEHLVPDFKMTFPYFMMESFIGGYRTWINSNERRTFFWMKF